MQVKEQLANVLSKHHEITAKIKTDQLFAACSLYHDGLIGAKFF